VFPLSVREKKHEKEIGRKKSNPIIYDTVKKISDVRSNQKKGEKPWKKESPILYIPN
jgi:hypothetical protein